MSEMLRFFPCLITSPVFPHLSSIVTTNFGPRNWPLKAGRLASTKSGWHSRIITVSVGVVHCAHVLCDFIPLLTHCKCTVRAASRGPDCRDLWSFLLWRRCG